MVKGHGIPGQSRPPFSEQKKTTIIIFGQQTKEQNTEKKMKTWGNEGIIFFEKKNSTRIIIKAPYFKEK
jgi:hypothetical protein